MKPKTQHFHSLDTLRGVACVLIAIYHMTNMRWKFGGHVLVDLFLVLSGFVLAHSYLYGPSVVGKREFLVRRFARMWPLHVFTLFFTFGVVSYGLNGLFFTPPGSGVHNNWLTLFEHLTMTHNLGFPPNGKFVSSWNFPSWSISVEFWVNVLFILTTTRKTPSWRFLLLSVVCLGIVMRGWGTLATFNENYLGYFNSGLMRGLASFFLGVVSYRLFLRYRHIELGPKTALGLEVGSIALTVFFLYIGIWGYPLWEFLAPYFFMFMIALFAMHQGALSQASVRLRYVGVISYSIYLNHIAVMIFINHRVVTSWLPREWIIPFGVVILLIFSHFTYKYIERPSQRFILRKWLPPREQTVG
ncbi:MAG TPA: acyltransferase [Planctomycetota bacterium]|nr:acyltransferase [Planctomycetota bacterium]